MENIIKMKGIRKVYEAGTIATHALREVDLTIAKGEFVSIAGPSGSGKSTLLNIIGLLERYDDGTYELDGVDVRSLNDDEASELRNEKIGFIFQNFNLIPELTLFDNVEVPLIYRGMQAKERKQRVEEALQLVGLLGRKGHRPDQLSGGQRQRVAIARALAGKPSLILADEPTGNLDSEMAASVMELLKKINEMGNTIVMVTHDDALAAKTHRQIHFTDGIVKQHDFKAKLVEINPEVANA